MLVTRSEAVEYHPTVREMPVSDRPRERLQYYGPEALQTAELLAIILRTGTTKDNVIEMATRLLSKYGGLAGLMRVDFGQLCNEYGVGAAKAAQVKAALELGRRLAVLQPDERVQVRSPADAARLLMLDMAFLQQEHLRVILLDTKNYVVHIERVYQGSVNMSVVRAAEIFRAAVSRNAPSIIIVHNHPSGDPTPSPEDIRTTEQLVQAGRHLDIDVLDHIVIGHQRFVSMKERKLGFS